MDYMREQFEAWQEKFYTYPLDTTWLPYGYYQHPVTAGQFAVWKAALSARQPQACELAQFRAVVEVLVDHSASKLTDEQFILAGRLLNLIDGKA